MVRSSSISPFFKVLLVFASCAVLDQLFGLTGVVKGVRADNVRPGTVVPADPHLVEEHIKKFSYPRWYRNWIAAQQKLKNPPLRSRKREDPELEEDDPPQEVIPQEFDIEHDPDCEAAKAKGEPCPEDDDGPTTGRPYKGQNRPDERETEKGESENGLSDGTIALVPLGKHSAADGDDESGIEDDDVAPPQMAPGTPYTGLPYPAPPYPPYMMMMPPSQYYAGGGAQQPMVPMMGMVPGTFKDDGDMMEGDGMMMMPEGGGGAMMPEGEDNPVPHAPPRDSDLRPGDVHYDINWMLRGPANMDNEEYERYLFELSRFFSDRSRLEVLGYTVQGRPIYAVVLCFRRSDCTKTPLLKPKVRLVANLHGNHGTSRAILTFLIEYLLSYQEVNPRVHQVVSTTEIHIIPSVNLDGFELAYDDWKRLRLFSNISEGLNNANGVDLETDYPRLWDYNITNLESEGSQYWNVRQPETYALMQHSISELFVLSGTFSDDDVLVQVPLFDQVQAYQDDDIDGIESRPPDFDVFKEIGYGYALQHPLMREYGFNCPGDTSRPRHSDGVENGALVTQVTPGHAADWHYKFANAFDLWIHIACFGFSTEEVLEIEWQKNVNPIITFLEEAHLGIKGMVWENRTGAPLSDVFIEVRQRRHRVRTNSRGEYFRLLKDGVYFVRPMAPGYLTCDWEQVVVINSMGPTLQHFYLMRDESI